MAINGVMRLGEVQVRVMDMKATLHHYLDVLGLIKVADGDDGRVYLKCWDEHDHHSVVLREADSPGLDHAAFKVRRDGDLDGFARKTRDFGLAVEEIPAGRRLASGRRIRMQTPMGHWIELYAEMEKVGNGRPERNPDPFPDGLSGVAPNRLEHLFVFGPNIRETARYFIDVLDFGVSESLDLPDGNPKSVFLACNTAMHDIGLVEYPEPGKLHHFSFWLDSLEQVHRAGLLFGKNNVSIDTGLSQHGIGRAQTIYFFDPSGNRNEVFSGSYLYFPDQPTLHWDITNVGRAIFYPEGRVDPSYLEVLT